MTQLYHCDGGGTRPLSKFNFQKENVGECLWETRVPGTDAEETWDSGEHSHKALDKAVRSILPDYQRFGLSMPMAAKLLLRLGLILGTGAEKKEFRA